MPLLLFKCGQCHCWCGSSSRQLTKNIYQLGTNILYRSVNSSLCCVFWCSHHCPKTDGAKLITWHTLWIFFFWNALYIQYHGFKSKTAWPARDSNWVRLKVNRQADDRMRGLLNGVKLLCFLVIKWFSLCLLIFNMFVVALAPCKSYFYFHLITYHVKI